MKTELDKNALLKLFDMAVSEHHYYLDQHHKRVEFFTGLISALFSATVLGAFQVEEDIHYLFLLLGPVLIFAVCQTAIVSTGKTYQVFLEAITVRAKIEMKLGLAEAPSEQSGWRHEPIVPKRHISNRKNYEGSDKFVKGEKDKALQRDTRNFFRFFQIVALAVGIGFIALTVL